MKKKPCAAHDDEREYSNEELAKVIHIATATLLSELGAQFMESDKDGRAYAKAQMDALHAITDAMHDLMLKVAPPLAEIVEPKAILITANALLERESEAAARSAEAYERAMYIAHGGNA